MTGMRIFGEFADFDFRIWEFLGVFGVRLRTYVNRNLGLVKPSKLEFALRSKTEGLTQTGPTLDRDRSGPFSGTVGLGSVRSTESRSVFGLPYLKI